MVTRKGLAGLRFHLRRTALPVFLVPLLALIPLVAFSQPLEYQARGRLGTGQSSEERSTVTFSPILLEGGATLTLISPPEWSELGTRLSNVLERTHRRFSKLFGELPPVKTSLRLIDEETFYLSTGAPRWTNALFYRGQIIIPLSSSRAAHSVAAPANSDDFDDIARSLQHEYTHAVTHALSGGKCPGWLDEGLAQWAEGSENPALRPALVQYLHGHTPVPLALLQGGFTRLETDMVAAAYAQSLIAAQAVVQLYGYRAVRNYFDLLKMGVDKGAAFRRAFGLTEDSFEQRMSRKLISSNS